MSTHDFEKPAPQASLHQLAAILQSAVDAVISIDAVGTIESVNPATERLFGYDAATLIGQNIKLLMPEPFRSEHDNYIRQYRHTGRRRIIGIGREVVGQRKDGTTFPMHLSVSEYEVEGQRHFAGIVHDLTAQKQAEEERLRQQTLLQAIVNDAPQAIVIADAQRKIFLVNPATTNIFGYLPEELIGKNSRFLYATDEDYEKVAHLRLNFTVDEPRGAVEPMRIRMRRKSGEEFAAEIIATVIRDAQRNVLGVMGLVRDITHQLKQEEALRQSQRLDALGQLTGGIAHDFNNLLTIIIGNLELFEDSVSPDEAKEVVRRANEAAEMGARLTGRLLTFSRQRKLEASDIDLNELILGMMELLVGSVGETISVTTSLAPGLGRVRIDPSEIENAVLNLVINARDAMPKGGRLVIETDVSNLSPDDSGSFGLKPGRYVRLSVSDTGTGMSPEIVARAFEPFFTTKQPGRGTGLGLSSLYGFVKQSGGNASIYSEPSRGTTVNLYLPTVIQAGGAGKPALDKQLDAGSGETVLVVEDNPELRRLSVRRLELLGYRVVEADSGPAALAVLQASNEIDLIFSDIVMPGGMTGYELAQQARRAWPAVKVLLCSGYDAEVVSLQDTTESSFEVLRKPYKLAELARALRETLGG